MLPALILACVAFAPKPLSGASAAILDEVHRRIGAATTITVTVVELHEEFPRPFKTKWWFKKGGYYRSESKYGTLIASPTRCWSYIPKGKGYKVFPGAQTDWSLSRQIGIGDFGDRAQMPTIGAPKRVKWHGMAALRIEVDGRRTMTKETKLYFFFDTKTHNPLGVSANLGSITQVRIFSDLKINPKIKSSMFRFVPSKGWHLVKG